MVWSCAKERDNNIPVRSDLIPVKGTKQVEDLKSNW